MTEPTPPPERPLSDEARARIRADLLTHAHEHRSAAPRWLVPAVAAAAVALVAGLSYWAISPDGSEPGGLPVTGGGTSTVPSEPVVDPTSAPSEGASASTPAAPSTNSQTETTSTTDPKGSDDAVQVGTRACPEEMEHVIKGATLALQLDEVSSFWVKGDRFVQCDELDGRTTVHKALPLTPSDSVATYAVSTDILEGGTTRSAGGIVPSGSEGVFDVTYTFSDGHTEHATTSTDDQGRTWWRMAYTYDDGGGNEMDKPQIEVTMSLSGVQKHYTLEWFDDTCAQANHGC